MNTKNLQRHYDKLTALERFPAVIAAGLREDEIERRALLDSAPVVTFEFPHTMGLHEGFRDLSRHHVIQQLGAAGSFWMLIYMSEVENAAQALESIESEELPADETALTLTARRFMEGLEAYRAVCVEYGIDPGALDEIYNPYPLLTGMIETIVSKGLYAACIELKDLEETKQAYRAIIEESRRQWAETRAR